MSGGLSTDLPLGIVASASMGTESLAPATPAPDISATAAPASTEAGHHPAADGDSRARRRRRLAEDSDHDDGPPEKIPRDEEIDEAHRLDQLA
jgi:hypothetical protein